MERSEKLAKLKKRDAGKSNLLVVGNGNDFVEILEATVGELKTSLGNGVALNNLDDLLDQLSVLQSFQKEVKDLRDSIKAIDLPESVKIEGLDELVASIKVIAEKKVPKAEKLDPAPFVEISEKVTILTDKISSLKAEPQGKAPADYIPTRRVMKVGNQLLFDDSFYTGGGGGGSSTSGTTYNGIINGATGGSATVTGGKLDVNATASLAGQAIPSVGATTAVTTQIVDGSGNQITTFGGGTQFADGAARGTATGTIAMVDDGTNIQSLSGDSTGKLNVNNISGTVSLPTGAATAAKQLADGHNVVVTSGNITADTELPAAAALADTTANPTVPAVGSFLMGWDGSGAAWDRLKQQGLNADAQTAHAKGVLETASNGYVYNGTTWDRQRSAANATNSTGTGLPTAQVVGQFDDVAPTSITENQFGNLRMSANRNLYGTIRDAAGNERGANVTSANALLVAVDGAQATGDTTMQSAVSATGNGSSLTITGYGTALLQVSGTFSATVTFEASSDAGTTWANISATQIGGDIVTSTTSIGSFRITCTGFDLLRARVTWTSGTSVTVVGRATNAVNAPKIIKLSTGTNAIGTVGTSPNAINVGQKTVSTTAVQISATATVPTNGILVQALAANTAAIYVGGSGVTTGTGWELSAGQSIAFTCTLNTLYIISVASTTDKICYTVV